MNSYKAKELISRYHQGLASPQECRLVEQWFLIDLKNSISVPDKEAFEKNELRISAYLAAYIHKTEAPYRYELKRLWPRIAGIAAALTLITLGIWLYTSRHSLTTDGRLIAAAEVIPGKNMAVLTLAGGQTINLSDAKSGIVIDADKLTYSDGTAVSPDFHTGNNDFSISTPRGGTYQVKLPDGTTTWLNAESSLTYTAPSKAQGGHRRVKLAGEAYFEVAKDLDHPFVVGTGLQDVKVLGTHFNISAYKGDQIIKTTLLEGLVKLYFFPPGGNVTTIEKSLFPNQQAVVIGDQLIVKKVDAREAIAWKEGYFMFNDENLEQIMKRVGRWYNVEVEYEDESAKSVLYYGTVSRFENLDKVLSKLEATGNLRFRMSGKKVIVSK